MRLWLTQLHGTELAASLDPAGQHQKQAADG